MMERLSCLHGNDKGFLANAPAFFSNLPAKKNATFSSNKHLGCGCNWLLGHSHA